MMVKESMFSKMKKEPFLWQKEISKVTKEDFLL
jgi:hypothetical protein